MARPRSDDPKEALTVRLRRSLAMRVTGGEDWRARLEAVIAAAYEPVVVVKAEPREAPKQRAATKPFVSRLKGEWKPR